MPMRRLSTGKRACSVNGDGRGYIVLHCPRSLSLFGRVNISTLGSSSPPTATNLPSRKATLCDSRGFDMGATNVQTPMDEEAWLLPKWEVSSISTVDVGPPALILPPIAKRRPSGTQIVPKFALASCISGNSCQLFK